MRKLFLLPLLFIFVVSACTSRTPNHGLATPPSEISSENPTEDPSQPSETSDLSSVRSAQIAATRSPTRDSSDWKSWPVLPTVSEEMRELYQRGLESGTDSHSFSILGDCQSQPTVFMGLYDHDSVMVAALPENLQQTIDNFSGSFDRYSPTVKDGATTGGLLWAEWNDNLEKSCDPHETALDCELRVHKPSIVFINIGTHWETRNFRYLTLIVEKIIASGAVPFLTLKADDRETDERINKDTANLAIELGLPVWNFWAAVHGLPNGGISSESSWALTDQALEIHRRSALEALDAVWRALN